MCADSLSHSSSKKQIVHALCYMEGGGGSHALRLSKPSTSTGMSPLHNCSGDVSGNIMADLGNGNYSIAQHLLSPQIRCPQNCSNHFNLFSTCVLSPNPRPLRVLPPGDVPDDAVFPIGTLNSGKEISDPETEILYNNSGFCSNPPLEWFDTSSNSRVNPSRRTLDATNADPTNNFSTVLCPIEDDEHMKDFVVPLFGYTAQVIEAESASMSRNSEKEILVQDQASMKQESDADCLNPAELPLTLTLPSGGAGPHSRINDKLRRAKISQGIKELQNSVPCSDKGNKESVLDDVIDYIKFLKLQLQVLSQSRLSGEDAAYPFVYLEGYGHYLIHQQTSKEPLEEIMGQLMESNMQAASELLGNKGLAILPMDFAYTLLQTSFGA